MVQEPQKYIFGPHITISFSMQKKHETMIIGEKFQIIFLKIFQNFKYLYNIRPVGVIHISNVVLIYTST